jgi:Cysteine sulfinate desulfinase/cysteine desulfurase and related enzymes
MTQRSIRRIYMDYQASTPVDPRVQKAMLPYFSEKPGNPHASDHSFGWEANAAIESAAMKIAQSINADPDEIIFTSGATEANNLLLLGAAAHGKNGKRKRLITSPVEHKSVLDTVYYAADTFGYKVEMVPVSTSGVLDLSELEKMLDDDVLLVSAISVNNEIGTSQHLSRISQSCRKYGSLFHTDSVHLLPTTAIDVQKNGIDAMSLSAHKIYGPKGVGALYIKRSIQSMITPLFYGGGQQNGLRPGTLPVGLCVGLGEAIQLFDGDAGVQERQRVREQRDKFVEGLTNADLSICANGSSGQFDHPGNANISFSGVDAHELLGTLQPTLAAATGSACTSGSIEASHVLRALRLGQEVAQSSVRFSIGRFTTDDEIDEAALLVSQAVKELTAF